MIPLSLSSYPNMIIFIFQELLAARTDEAANCAAHQKSPLIGSAASTQQRDLIRKGKSSDSFQWLCN